MIKIKNDRFRSSRGGASKVLTLGCGSCRSIIFDYQKDGKGNLIRLYLDRITNNYHNVELQSGSVKCPACSRALGNISIYKKENRVALFLERGALVKLS